MRKEYLITILFFFAVSIQAVFAAPFAINYFYANTDSQPEYLNIQYGHFQDNVSLKLRLQATNGYTNVPVIVSLKVYGILDNGQLAYLYSVPSTTNYAYSSAYDYVYPNVFYINPNYYGYMVKIYAESFGVVYSTYSQAYVYPVNTAPYYYFIDDTNDSETNDSQDNTTDCSDFFLSGMRDIYLDEGESKTYNLYVENETNDPLSILDVDTTNPSNLDIDDIDYPSTVPSNSVRTIRVYVEADSVSDDYDSSFDITVSAKYANTQVCTKTYTVEYHIDEKDSDNDASCSDLVIRNTSFTIPSNYSLRKTITLENNSDDYDFEIDDIIIDDRSGITARIVNEPDEISADDSESLEIEFETDDFDYTTIKYLPLEITGNFTRSGHDDKECTRKVNLAVTIENNGYYYPDSIATTSCKNILIYAKNINQEEETTKSYSREDGFFILNNSNSTFTITNLSINDNTNYASISNLSFPQTLTSRATGSINFTLSTNNVSSTQNPRGTISVSGRFTDGKTCSYSNIDTKYFDLTISEPTNKSCSAIKVDSKTVAFGNNQVSIYNSSNKKFYVNDVLFQNKYGLSANASNKQLTIPANNNSQMIIGITGTGSLEMLVSGRFEDGKQCTFVDTVSGILTTRANQGTLLPTDCDFQVIAPTAIEINNSQETISATFKNNTSKNGRIEITGSGLITDPSIIFLSGFDNFTKNITLSNFNNPSAVYYTVMLNNCPSTRTFTNIVSNISVSERISLVSYPTLISPVTNNVAIITSINNSFTRNKDVTIKLSGFPSDFMTSPKSTTLSAHETKNISLEINIPENAKKIEYKGHIELYSNNKLLNKYPITINLSPETQAITINSKAEKVLTQDRTYKLTLTLKNNTKILQNTIVDFGLSETYVIDGDKELNILPGEEITKIYKIVSPTLLKEDTTLNIKIKDKTTGQEITNQKLTLQSGVSPLSAFFTLANTGLVILGIIIIIALILIFKKKK